MMMRRKKKPSFLGGIAVPAGARMEMPGGLMGAVQNKMMEDKILKAGNPYEIARVGGMHYVRKKGGGAVKGKFKTYKQALRQFNLLEGIHRGWKPTGKPARK
jgi:hypothetical protein